MKILNLYAGIGGNRKLWGNEHEITAVELNPEVAQIYNELYPNDNIIIDDAHDYLLRNYKNFDFIWTSPPCPSHSLANLGNINRDSFTYPDMSLYQEIILLKTLFKGKYVVENVTPYYQPLIEPTFKIGRHCFWASNFIMSLQQSSNLVDIWDSVWKMENAYGFDLSKYKLNYKFKRKILRNCVKPEIGKYIFDSFLQIM